jgi:small ligand-binding sensory domain FIST
MKVKVRGGYKVVNVAGHDRKEGEIFDISESDHKGRHWVFDIVEETPAAKEVKVVVETVAEEDASNRAIDSPIIRRGRIRGKG